MCIPRSSIYEDQVISGPVNEDCVHQGVLDRDSMEPIMHGKYEDQVNHRPVDEGYVHQGALDMNSKKPEIREDCVYQEVVNEDQITQEPVDRDGRVHQGALGEASKSISKGNLECETTSPIIVNGCEDQDNKGEIKGKTRVYSQVDEKDVP